MIVELARVSKRDYEAVCDALHAFRSSVSFCAGILSKSEVQCSKKYRLKSYYKDTRRRKVVTGYQIVETFSTVIKCKHLQLISIIDHVLVIFRRGHVYIVVGLDSRVFRTRKSHYSPPKSPLPSCLQADSHLTRVTRTEESAEAMAN
jgi:hypothetical protein